MKKGLFIVFTGLVLMCILAVSVGVSTKAEGTSMTEKKVLVAYFSATGVTKKVAERLAKVTKADLFEIKPAKPYTDADLNWMDEQSRSSVEMKDKSCRPEMASKLKDIGKYEVVFVGFPVWWYREPSIIDTFIEAYDFSGKTIVPFATSGGSPIGDSWENIQELAPNAKVFRGKCFPANSAEDSLKTWAAEHL